MNAPGPAWRVPMLVAGMLCLIAGVAAGLARLGWAVRLPAPQALAYHGALMISGFFGTVIALERAVALKRAWPYLGPVGSGLGGLALALGVPGGAVLAAIGSAVLLAASVVVLRQARTLYAGTLALGAACWLAGNLMWASGVATAAVVPVWICFLLLTIAGERLELSRFLPPVPAAKRLFTAVVAVLLGGAAAAAAGAAKPGGLLFGAGLLGLSAWLLGHDVARRNVHATGLTRFIAACLLAGYAWLAVGAVIALAAGGFAPGSLSYDAALHAVLLGFVFSMVFGHAPIIFPAVLAVPVPYTRFAWVPLAALAASLVVRIAGDLAGDAALRSAGAGLNALALALFVAGMIGTVLYGLAVRSR